MTTNKATKVIKNTIKYESNLVNDKLFLGLYLVIS